MGIRRGGWWARSGAWPISLGALVLACESGPAREPAQPPPARRVVEQWRADESSPAAAEDDGVPALATDSTLASGPAPVATRAPPLIEPAAAIDHAYDSDEPVTTRRYVYRVRLAIPAALGNGADLATPAAELFLDVSSERVRARFVGQGWPVDTGAEVRLRGDSPGAYVFDGAGGRPLLPGQLAEWFEGGERRPGPRLSVRRDPTMPSGEATGTLVCALLAEWAGEPRDAVVRRCDGRAPIGFRVGLWRAERTADLQVELPRRSLRADEVGPPDALPSLTSRAFFEPASLARIAPRSVRGEEIEARDPEAPPEGLLFVNQSGTRVIVTVQGVPIGWVAPHAEAYFVGLLPGAHDVGGLRPMGSIALRPRLLELPARTVLRGPRAPRP